jgi:ERCC4-related helicase
MSIEKCEEHCRLLDTINEIRQSMDEIKKALLGSFEETGFITETRNCMKEHSRRIDELEQWQKDATKTIKTLVFKMFGWMTGATAVVVAIGEYLRTILQ